MAELRSSGPFGCAQGRLTRVPTQNVVLIRRVTLTIHGFSSLTSAPLVRFRRNPDDCDSGGNGPLRALAAAQSSAQCSRENRLEYSADRRGFLYFQVGGRPHALHRQRLEGGAI